MGSTLETVLFYCLAAFIIAMSIMTVTTQRIVRSATYPVSYTHLDVYKRQDYMLWPSILWGCLIVVILIGACAGSTTGGIKCIRMVILFKVAKNEDVDKRQFDKRFLLVGANITFSPQSSTEFHGVFYYFAHPVKLSVALLLSLIHI